jgi:hypothetical protein
MKSGGKSLYRQQPKEDDLQRPHSVRNLVIGTGVLGAITLICWYGAGASQSGSSSNGFITCSAANCPAAPGAGIWESPAAAQANANGSSSGNPKAIGGSTKRSGTVTGLSPIISALINPPTTGKGTTVGPVVHPSTSASGTTPTTPATVKPTTVAPTTVKPTTVAPTTVAPTTVAPTTVAPTTVAPTTVAPTTVAPTTVAPTTVPPTSADPVTS